MKKNLPCLDFSGEKGTLTHGSVVDGKFEGFIQSYHGTYYVEPAQRYLEDKDVPFHSVIYHEDDIRKSVASAPTPTLCQAVVLYRPECVICYIRMLNV